MVRRFLKNYALRHQHPANIALHVLGLPVTFVLPWFLWSPDWWWAAGAFLAGYALQFAGHAIEGNDAGEVVLVKKLLGMPFIDIVQPTKQSTNTH